ERESLDMVQNDDRPLIDAQAAEAALQLVAIGHLRELITAGRVVEWQLADLGRSLSPLPARLAMAGPHEDSVKPGLEPIGVAKRREGSPSRHESVLGDVGGSIRIDDDTLSTDETPTRA